MPVQNGRDSNPSLSINDTGYKCFGCGIHGNGPELIKQVKKYSFQEALNWLEFEYGIIPTPTNNENTQNQNLEERKKKYHIRFIKSIWC